MDQTRLYQLIISNLPVGFSRVDRHGNIVEFNHAAERITGHNREDLIGKSHLAILHGPQAAACPLFDSLRKRAENIATEAVVRTKSGQHISISVTSFPLIDKDGTFLGGVEIFRDISELKQLERERKNILSMFAHDMKNPVVTALGFLRRVLTGKAGPLSQKQEEHLKQVRVSIEAVEQLIRDFLDFSRYEAMEFTPVFASWDIAASLAEQVKTAKLEAERKKINFQYQGPEKAMIEADGAMVSRAIANLLDNAIRYTGEGGKITATLSERSQEVVVRVSDTGFGIPRDQLPLIFDAFYRANTGTKGSGLGLSIVKSVTEAHGGRVWVESESGRGSTFFVALPKKQSS